MKKIKRAVICILALLLTVVPVYGDAMIVPDYQDVTVDYYVIVSAPDGGVNFRYGAGVEYDQIISNMIPNGEILHIVGERTASTGRAWGYTCYQDMWGYVALSQTSYYDMAQAQAEAAAKAEAERQQKEAEAKAEAERQQKEAEAKAEAERLQAEAAAKAEAERLQREEETKAKEEAERQQKEAEEEARRLKKEAEEMKQKNKALFMKLIVLAVICLVLAVTAVILIIYFYKHKRKKNR
nr:hypothetical protein [uncultured Blautia sp.]